MSPQSSVSGTTVNVRRYSLRRRDSGSRARIRFKMLANSISRESFRRSSLGLARKAYVLPSLPTSVTFFGFWSDTRISTRSTNRRTVGAAFGKAAWPALRVSGGRE